MPLNLTLDTFLPDFHVHEVHAIRTKAPAATVWSALQAVTPQEIPLFRAMFSVRALPGIITRRGPIPFGGKEALPEQMLANRFVLLAENPQRKIVLGAIGQFWKPFAPPLRLADAQEFLRFDRLGYAKAAMSMPLERSDSDRHIFVRTETRVLVLGSSSRWKMRAYWLLIRLGSGLIRRMWLQAVKRRAERLNQ